MADTSPTRIATQISALKTEICSKVFPQRDRVPWPKPEARDDRLYTTSLLNYLAWIEGLAHDYQQRVDDIAGTINKLEKTNWQGDGKILRLWMELTRTVEHFRHDPVKGAGSIYVTPDNRMICFAAGGFADGLDMTILAHLESRRPYRHCSERKGPCNALGLSLPAETDIPVTTYEHLTGDERQRAIHQARVERLHQNLLAAPKQLFTHITLFTTIIPCMPCAEFISTSGTKKVYVSRDGDLTPYRRLTSMKEGESYLRGKGVEILIL